MLNKNIVHLIDDIFWNMGFKTETQADKVMLIISIIRILSIMCIILIISLIRIIAGSSGSWNCRPRVAGKENVDCQSVDNLGDHFRPAIRAGWLSYICRVYPHDGAPDACLVVGEGTFVVQE